jgi:hypothetical protein
MVNLRVVGALDRCPAFAEPLDLRRVSLTNITNERSFFADNLQTAKAIGTDPALITALERGANPRAPGRLLLQLMLAGWRLTRRVVPVRRVNGRIRWGRRPAGVSGGALLLPRNEIRAQVVPAAIKDDSRAGAAIP